MVEDYQKKIENKPRDIRSQIREICERMSKGYAGSLKEEIWERKIKRI